MALVDQLANHDAVVGHLFDDRDARSRKRRGQDCLELIDVKRWHDLRLPAHLTTPHKSAVAFAMSRAHHHNGESAMTKLEQTEIGVARAQAVLDRADRGVLELQDVLTKVQLGLDQAGRLSRAAKTARKVLLAALLAAGFGALVMVGLKLWRSSTQPEPSLDPA